MVEHRHRVRAIGCDREIEDDVGEVDILCEIGADGCIGVEDKDPGGIFADLELALGADHPVRLDSADLPPADLEPTREDGTRFCEGHYRSDLEVPRATDHVDGGSGLVVDDLTQPDLVGVGMGLHADDLRDDHLRPVGLERLDPLDLVAERLERLPDRSDIVRRQRDVVGKPVQRDSHGAPSSLSSHVSRPTWFGRTCDV